MEYGINILESGALMPKNRIDFMECIRLLESGEENIYFVDEAGRFAWHVLQGKAFRMKYGKAGELLLPFSTNLAPIIFTLPINEENKEALMTACKARFEQDVDLEEIPIIGADGRIVARARRDSTKKKELEWERFKGLKYGWPKEKICIASTASASLNKLAELLEVEADILSGNNVGAVLQGRTSMLLVYDRDIYPAEINKISVEELYDKLSVALRFQQNMEALAACTDFHGYLENAKLPDRTDEIKPVSKIKDFLAQVESEKPILLEDAYDTEELAWMCDKLRVSDRFGSDNHLYLQYSSWEDFLCSLKYLDWKYVAETGKAVFLFSKEEKEKFYYPRVNAASEPMPLEIGEITELIESIPRGFSGSDFFNMILDNHPSLLTIGMHGLPTFTALWKVFCENNTTNEAINKMKNPQRRFEEHLIKINLRYTLNRNKYESLKMLFFDCLLHYLEGDKQYKIDEWFKACYLSVNELSERHFRQRIVPAIFYDEHGGQGQDTLEERFGLSASDIKKLKINLLKGFKYTKHIGVVRSPFGTCGCMNNYQLKPNTGIRGGRANPYNSINNMIKRRYGKYMTVNSQQLDIYRQVRFEDLKLYPEKTTVKLCDFLRIPWSETCLQITINGEDSGVIDGTEGFDTRPVYNPHAEHLSSFDYYRIELLNYKNYQVWGYKMKYYDGMKFSREELKKLYDIPFKIETQKLEKYPDWPNEKASKEFHDWILARAIDVMENGEKDPVDANGNPMQLVECLFPDLKPGQRLFEC